MNYTDEQIRLAGFVQPDEGPRDFNSVLDLQGEGTRVLDQYIAEVEAEEGDCCADLGIAESTIAALATENDDLQAENGELQEDLEAAAQVGGGGSSVNETLIVGGTPRGSLSVNITCTYVEEHATQSGKYTRYHFSCTWTCEETADLQDISGATRFVAVWVDGNGIENRLGSRIPGAGTGFVGVAPWYFVKNNTNSGSCLFYVDISPFVSDSTATIYNTTRFEMRANDVYSPKSAYVPVLYRSLGDGSPTNGTTIDPNA